MTVHIILTMIALVLILVGGTWYAKKRFKISLAVMGLGAIAFFVSSQVLEKIVHLLVLHPQKDGTILLAQEHPFLYVLYGIAMAALFEETARFIFFKWLEKKRKLEDRDAWAYGLGHGGLEMLYLGMGSLISLLILFSLLQSSNSDAANLLTKSTLETVQSLSAWQVYLLGVERVLALVLQISLTVWVYQSVIQKKWIYLVAAYSLHALFDLAPALSQVGWITNPLLVEFILLAELIALVWLTKSTFWKKS
ncbi:YhfC family intramembrane metalloprotease [Streptococcus sp. CF10-1]|uniref:YhfC family intramembrane metalloprotease n=1 Tax=Streptococcus sp. CF10-1 TaxID=2963162 RepID=UPI0020C8CA60|nr:YhfC family glutamic-type intramembrane protease [Streptococcus sp. CF10-1]MCP9081958.1 YhfC family glutamic-type intramembrane protease [Streptococcus sp. CF10-1]